MDEAPSRAADVQGVKDVLYRYASVIDQLAFRDLRALFVDDARVRYGDRDWMQGADQIVDWIEARSAGVGWQHHMLNVYHVALDGDEASALTYHTSHVISSSEPDVAAFIVARYHDRLRRDGADWKIAEKWMEIGWRETRPGVSLLSKR